MSANILSRTSRGSGISKRGGGPRVRMDRDGDLDMDGPAGGARGGRGGGGGGRNNNTNNNRNNDAGGNTARGGRGGRGRGGSGAGGGGGRNARRDPVGTRRDGGAPLFAVKVRGWRDTKGSADECIQMLERKTQMKFKKV